jgi:hypothetical protein
VRGAAALAAYKARGSDTEAKRATP